MMTDAQKASFRCVIHCAARDGLLKTLYTLLDGASESDCRDFLGVLLEDNEEVCTPLLIAARNGHKQVVEMLLDNFGSTAELELEGTVWFDGYVKKGATPLWCAAGAGHLDIVRILVERGADVNHHTRAASTPLRAASFDGRLDTVPFLVQNDADIDTPNIYNNTCLMIAAYNGHTDVVHYLLTQGADPNVQADSGLTALHFSAARGHLDIVRHLLAADARVLTTKKGLTPLQAAAESTRAEVVEYILEQLSCTRQEKIDALELLGASFANDKDSYSLERAFHFLDLAMHERQREPPLYKKRSPVVAAYDSRVECAMLDDLLVIRNDAHALHMESLAIRERILGQHSTRLHAHIVYRGAELGDSGDFDRCLKLWMHALWLHNVQLHSVERVSLCDDLCRIAQLFGRMLYAGKEVPPDAVMEVLAAATCELLECSDEDNDINMLSSLYLLVVVTKLRFSSASQEDELLKRVRRLVELGRVTRGGCTLLHLCVSADTPVEDDVRNIYHFPCIDTTRLLLSCGANPNTFDARRNTPLHAVVTSQKPAIDFSTLHSIITALIEAGAHTDAANACGETAAEASTTPIARAVIKIYSQMTLKCLAARVAAKYGLSYYQAVELPKPIVQFVEMHGGCERPFRRQRGH